MGLKSFNPYTASRRFMTVLDKSEITKETPEKALLEPKKRSGGRNNQGEISVWHREGCRDRVRPESQCEPGALALRRWRQALHPSARGARSRRNGFHRR